MDGSRFDDLTRRLVGATTRRRLLGRLAGGTAAGMAGLIGRGGATAGPRRCPLSQRCGELCCPPENVGCFSPHELPDGTVTAAHCVCPAGTRYDPVANACVPCVAPGGACQDDDDCCDGEHLAGSCVEGTCRCCNSPKGQINCADRGTSTPDDGFCCEAPLVSGACCTEYETAIDCPCFWLCHDSPQDTEGWSAVCPEGTWLIGAFGWEEVCDR